MRPRFLLPLLALLLAPLLTGCDRTPDADAAAGDDAPPGVEWKVAGTFPRDLPGLGELGAQVAERLALVSGGRLRLQVFAPGKLVPPLEVFDAVGQGTVDAGLSTPGSWFDRMPAVAFFASPPFGADTAEFIAWLYEGGGLAQWRDLYGAHGVVPVPCGYLPPVGGGWFRKPPGGETPFKGLRIHAYGLGGRVLARLGAQVQVLAARDVPAALERGALDAAQLSVLSVDAQMGLPKVARHLYLPGWQQQGGALELLVNEERWEALSDAQRAQVEVVCRDALVAGIAAGEARQSQALAELKRQGVQVHAWSAEQLKAIAAAYDQVLAELRKQDDDFADVYDAYREFHARYADWGRHSRLPDGL